MTKRSGNNRWLQRQRKDPYVRQAQQSRYRSRAVYKLIEIDQKDRLFHQGQTVLDLGAAPGSWSQYVSTGVGVDGKIVAVDILPMAPVDKVLFIQGDFMEQATSDRCLKSLEGRGVDLVISDMAPNLTGIRATDQARSEMLAERVLAFALEVLKPGGDLLIKVFEGVGVADLRRKIRGHFRDVAIRKPGASRDSSREFYILARSCRK
jgi:23S rRNA (uridine2552-2'-O)-methyltransferase